ncbi:MAG: branched-chain amino acid ABC transporter permease [Acidimicrobiaceae bacterium]|nr:branched-chain amino acid ABC transporter permease [Acidimicrobiaceae bacterium]
MLGRPRLYTAYRQEIQLLPTWTQKIVFAVFLLVLFLLPFDLPVISDIPVVRFLGDPEWLRPMAKVMVYAIAALGLNMLSGVAGQVSLGHAFFMGVGACAAVYLGGAGGDTTWGHSLPIWIWLPGAGVAAAMLGVVVSPVAVRLRGLYLAIVTLGLVFVGIHLGNTSWGQKIAGAPGLGREFPELDIRLWKEETPLVNVGDDGHWLWFDVSDAQKRYLFLLVITLALALVAKNLLRGRTGRALQAIRDRDIAAEVMGVPDFGYKLVAFAVSSFYAGVAGALFAALSQRVVASDFGLFLSVEFIAVLLIGGAGTTAGPMIGASFVVMAPEFVAAFTKWLEQAEGGLAGGLGRVLLTEGGDFGVINTAIQTPGWTLSVFDWNVVLFGALIVVFLIVEPLGLFGLWIRIRNYWKRWPFSY